MNNKGISLLGGLVATSILGISTLALSWYIVKYNKSIDDNPLIVKGLDFQFVHTASIQALKELLVEVKIDSFGEKKNRGEYGLCSLISPISKRQGVDFISLYLADSLTGKAKESFSSKRWEYFFSKFNKAEDNWCKKIDPQFIESNYFNRCFKYKGVNYSTRQIYVSARLVPKQLPDFSVIDLSKRNTFNAQLVVFELQITAGSKNDENELIKSRYYTMLWASDVPECHVQFNDEWSLVLFSGTGVGRNSKNIVVNDSTYSASQTCSEVQFEEFTGRAIRAKKVIIGKGGETLLATDHKKNVKLSCQKMVYRCPGEATQPTDIADSIKAKGRIFNSFFGELTLKKLSFTFVDSSGKEYDKIENRTLDGMDVHLAGDAEDKPSFNKTPLERELKVQPGIVNFPLEIKSSSTSPNSINQFCSSVCGGAKYYPALSVSFEELSCPSYDKKFNKEDSHRVRCTLCHAKECFKAGLLVMGPHKDEDKLQGLLDEPIDGNIPECALKNLTKEEDYKLPDISGGSGDCVSLSVSGVESFKEFKTTGQYSFEDCSLSLPVLCFAHGHYSPAIEISATGSAKIFKGPFSEAQRICYKQGKEIIKQLELENYFKIAGEWKFEMPSDSSNPPPKQFRTLDSFGLPLSGGYFSYVNNANRGLFIVPSYDVKNISRLLIEEGDRAYIKQFLPRYQKIWVAIEKDKGGQILSSIPQTKATESSFAIFKRKELPSRPLIVRDLNALSYSSKGHGTLLHNLSYKGVYPSSQSSGEILCKKKAGDFVFPFPTVSDIKKAPKTCKNNGAYWIPPVSSMEWVKAMSLLAPNDEMYPFPSPADFSKITSYLQDISVPAKKLLVALYKHPNETDLFSAKSWRLSHTHFPDIQGQGQVQESVFKSELFPNYADAINANKGTCGTGNVLTGTGDPRYIGIIDCDGHPVSLFCGEILNLNTALFKKVCYEEKGSDQVEIKDPVNADASCNTPAKEIDDQNFLKNKLKSIRFMSEWIQRNHTGNFIINPGYLAWAQIEVKNKDCKEKCQSKQTKCKGDCDDVHSRCEIGCSCDCGSPTEPDYASCQSACSSCRTDCSNQKKSCNDLCDTDSGLTCLNKCDADYPLSGISKMLYPEWDPVNKPGEFSCK